jgi:cytochrome bd-type quinol oxidase subunit 2
LILFLFLQWQVALPLYVIMLIGSLSISWKILKAQRKSPVIGKRAMIGERVRVIKIKGSEIEVDYEGEIWRHLFPASRTIVTLVIVRALFGASLRWVHALTDQEIKKIGAKTGGRTLFFGGLLFAIFGIVTALALDRYLTIYSDYAFIIVFLVAVAIPAFPYSLKEVLAERKNELQFMNSLPHFSI